MTTAEQARDGYRPPGGTPPEMPWLWLGTWSLGGEGFGPHHAGESLALLRRALDAGVRHLDTAGFYAHGRSEELVGEAIRDCRASVFVSTKGGLVWEGRRVRHRARPEDLRGALLASLRRLRTDYIDLFQLHWPDPEVPVRESLDALEALREEGLIRYWGAGNLTAEQVRAELVPGSAIPHQVSFNPLRRSEDVLGAGAEQGRCLNCVVSPFEQGLLADGRGSRGLDHLGKRDARQRNPLFRDPDALAWVAELQRLAEPAPVSRPVLVLLWILAQPDVHVVIPGPRETSQLGALLTLPEQLARLGLGPPDGTHCRAWQAALEDIVGAELWAHLGAGRE